MKMVTRYIASLFLPENDGPRYLRIETVSGSHWTCDRELAAQMLWHVALDFQRRDGRVCLEVAPPERNP